MESNRKGLKGKIATAPHAQSSRIPDFKSYEEEATWFDTHDAADL